MTQRLPKSVLNIVTFTIPSGQTTQGATGSTDAVPFLDLTHYILAGIEFPTTTTGTTFTLQVSNDAGVYDSYGALATAPTTYVPVTGVSFTKATGLVLTSSARALDAVGKYVQVISGSSEGALRTFKAHLVPRS